MPVWSISAVERAAAPMLRARGCSNARFGRTPAWQGNAAPALRAGAAPSRQERRASARSRAPLGASKCRGGRFVGGVRDS